MFERISGYDYRLEVDSNVTKCSFGSYKEICKADPRLQLYNEDSLYQKSEDQSPATTVKLLGIIPQIGQDACPDKGLVYRRGQLKMTAFHVLAMNRLKI